MKKLPYRVQTKTGDIYDVVFPLHRDTGDPVKVHQILSSLLGAIDAAVSMAQDTSNGDVLQALAMATAVRAGMVYAPHEVSSKLAKDLLETALAAMAASARNGPPAGHA